MGRILVLLLGLAVIAFAVKYELSATGRREQSSTAIETGIRPVDPNNPHTRPRQQLDNVRDRTSELSDQMQKNADELGKKSEGQ